MTDLAPITVDRLLTAHWAQRVGVTGRAVTDEDDVDQCLGIILTTRKGSVPLLPEFGCDAWKHLDEPLSEARGRIVAEIIDAIERWEPRVILRNITVEVLGLGHLLFHLVWTWVSLGEHATRQTVSVEIR